jgi:hypothetical protein
VNEWGKPWPFIGGGTRAWGKLNLYYFFKEYFFKRSCRASSTSALKAISLLTARILTSFINSLSRRTIADFLSLVFFLVAIEKYTINKIASQENT